MAFIDAHRGKRPCTTTPGGGEMPEDLVNRGIRRRRLGPAVACRPHLGADPLQDVLLRHDHPSLGYQLKGLPIPEADERIIAQMTRLLAQAVEAIRDTLTIPGIVPIMPAVSSQKRPP